MFRRKLTTAEEWAIRMNDRADGANPLSEAEREELTCWLVADRDHLKQLKTARLMSQLARRLSPEAVERIVARASAVRSRCSIFDVLKPLLRPPALAGLAVATSCVLVAAILLRSPDYLNRLKNHGEARTDIGQITSYVLPDNSNITIAANSSVQVDFSGLKRTIHLNQGEVYLDVEHDREHPFVVDVGVHQVVVTGTKLNVNYDLAANAVEVAVLEGKINVVRDLPARQDSQAMSAGEVILFPKMGPPVARNLTPEQAAAWRTRQLYFDEARLSEVFTEVNRYAPKPVVANSPEIERLTLTGQFTADDTATLLVSLQKLYGIRSEDQGDRWLLTSDKR
jgi:transmembrane sensor